MGNDNNGLRTFADLASMLSGMRAREEPAQAPRPQGPKPKREPTAQTWQPLTELPHPLPAKLEVTLKTGVHPKTGAPQWFGFYIHGQERLKVVCEPNRHELPAEGEVWLVTVTKQIPGIVFANLHQKVGESEALIAKRAKQAGEAAAALEAFRIRAFHKYVKLSISLPDDPQDFEPEVWSRVNHYSGTLVSWQHLADGTLEVTIAEATKYRSQRDIEGVFDSHTEYLDGPKTFVLHSASVKDRLWYDRESGERGSFQALCGCNPGRFAWSAKQWLISLND